MEKRLKDVNKTNYKYSSNKKLHQQLIQMIFQIPKLCIIVYDNETFTRTFFSLWTGETFWFGVTVLLESKFQNNKLEQRIDKS